MLYIILMHTSRFICLFVCLFFFFANDLLLFILYLFQSREMMLNKKQIRAVFLFEFKMSHKAAVTTHNISNAFGPGTANEHTIQWWFKQFCRGDKSLEDEEHSGWLLEVDDDQLRALLKLMLLKHHKRLPKNSASTILWSFGI